MSRASRRSIFHCEGVSKAMWPPAEWVQMRCRVRQHRLGRIPLSGSVLMGPVGFTPTLSKRCWRFTAYLHATVKLLDVMARWWTHNLPNGVAAAPPDSLISVPKLANKSSLRCQQRTIQIHSHPAVCKQWTHGLQCKGLFFHHSRPPYRPSWLYGGPHPLFVIERSALYLRIEYRMGVWL